MNVIGGYSTVLALRFSLDPFRSAQPLSNLVLRVASRMPSSRRSYASFIIICYILNARFLQPGADGEPETRNLLRYKRWPGVAVPASSSQAAISLRTRRDRWQRHDWKTFYSDSPPPRMQ